MAVVQRVASEDALERVKAALGDRATALKLNYNDVDITCDREHLVEVMRALRDTDGIRCEYFTFLSAVDWSEYGDEPRGLELLVHVYSPAHVIHCNVPVPIDFDDRTCPSISNVYRGALWHERETWEMFGIVFEDHPKLANLYLPEDFVGNPLLKSFKLPSRALVKEWPGAKDPDEAAAGGR